MRGVNFERWPVDGGKRTAVTFEVNLEGWTDDAAPSQPMPPLRAGTRDLFQQSYGEYGPNAGMQRLLRLFAEKDVRATVLTSGIIAERYPALLKAANEAGHEIAAHGYAQNLLSCYLSEEEEQQQMDATIAAITTAAGERPIGWRSPRSTPGTRTNALLAARRFLWHGNSDRADLPVIEHYSGRTIVALQRPTWVNDLIVCVIPARPPRALVEAFEDVFEYTAQSHDPAAHLISVAVHAHHFGRPHGAWALAKIIERVRLSSDTWIARNRDVAQVALETFEQDPGKAHK